MGMVKSILRTTHIPTNTMVLINQYNLRLTSLYFNLNFTYFSRRIYDLKNTVVMLSWKFHFGKCRLPMTKLTYYSAKFHSLAYANLKTACYVAFHVFLNYNKTNMCALSIICYMECAFWKELWYSMNKTTQFKCYNLRLYISRHKILLSVQIHLFIFDPSYLPYKTW